MWRGAARSIPCEEFLWALAFCRGNDQFLLGKYCWNNATETEPRVRTFRTRKLARAAKASLRSYRTAKAIKVKVTVESVTGGQRNHSLQRNRDTP